MSDEDCDAIAEFIRSRGITRCPTACVLPTQGLITAADRIALEQYAVARPSAARASRCPLAILDADGLTGVSLVWWLPVVPLMAAVRRPVPHSSRRRLERDSTARSPARLIRLRTAPLRLRRAPPFFNADTAPHPRF